MRRARRCPRAPRAPRRRARGRRRPRRPTGSPASSARGRPPSRTDAGPSRACPSPRASSGRPSTQRGECPAAWRWSLSSACRASRRAPRCRRDRRAEACGSPLEYGEGRDRHNRRAMPRATVIVMDACGVGALPDAADYGDAGANTLGHLAEAVGGLDLPALGALGLGSILPLAGAPPAAEPAVHGRLHPLGPGKDSTTGHWELMGVVPPQPPPTYPEGFPPEVVAVVGRVAGRGVLCNRPYNGITAIEDYGAEHLETGRLILYTSQDSVLQIAAHDGVLPVEELHAVCSRVRDALPREHAVGRIIARPFTGE